MLNIFLSAVFIQQLFSSQAGSSNDHLKNQDFSPPARLPNSSVDPSLSIPNQMPLHLLLSGNLPQIVAEEPHDAEELAMIKKMRKLHIESQMHQMEIHNTQQALQKAKLAADVAEEENRKILAEKDREFFDDLKTQQNAAKLKQAQARLEAANSANATICQIEETRLAAVYNKASAISTFWSQHLTGLQANIDQERELAKKLEKAGRWVSTSVNPFIRIYKKSEANVVKQEVERILEEHVSWLKYDDEAKANWALTKASIGQDGDFATGLRRNFILGEKDDRDDTTSHRSFLDIRFTPNGPNGEHVLAVVIGRVYGSVRKASGIEADELNRMTDAAIKVALHDEVHKHCTAEKENVQTAKAALKDFREGKDE